MCIVADIVIEVHNTRIFVCNCAYMQTESNDITPVELVIYSADVNSSTKSNAVILPVYNPTGKTSNIIPLDLSACPQILDDIEAQFKRWDPQVKSYMSTNGRGIETDSFSEPLPVHTVGDYQFSIMSSKKDFNRLDKTKLRVNPQSKKSIDVHSMDYSFIVFQFFKGGDLHLSPFGYIAPLSSSYDHFVPAIHGHPHVDSEYYGVPSEHKMSSPFEDTAHYDHLIMYITKSDNVKDRRTEDAKSMDDILKNIRSDYLQQEVKILFPNKFTHGKFTLKGNYANRNIAIKNGKYWFIDDLVESKNNVATSSSSPKDINAKLKKKLAKFTNPVQPMLRQVQQVQHRPVDRLPYLSERVMQSSTALPEPSSLARISPRPMGGDVARKTAGGFQPVGLPSGMSIGSSLLSSDQSLDDHYYPVTFQTARQPPSQIQVDEYPNQFPQGPINPIINDRFMGSTAPKYFEPRFDSRGTVHTMKGKKSYNASTNMLNANIDFE